MGTALLRGVLKAGIVQGSDVAVCDSYPASAQALKDENAGIIIADDAQAVVAQSEVVILAVKPKDMQSLLQGLSNDGKKPLFISIAAGTTLTQLTSWVGDGARVIRVMPNTPAQIGQGYSAFARSSSATQADADIAKQIFGAVGLADEVSEYLLDAITGLSGSGPAYIFTIIEALADGGVLMGLPRDAALRAAAQTLAGAAQMVIETGQHPATLRDAVTSPGGTTIAGLEQLEAHGLRNALIQAVRKATERSKALAS